MPGGVLAAVVVLVVGLIAPVEAAGHFERPGHFPDPAADTSVSPPAGGSVPEYRRSRGRLLVVCKRNSVRRALRLGATRKQMRRNRRLRKRCRFRHIQAAVERARNGDRIAVMPGRYREEPSRAKPTFDPACSQYRVHSEEQPAGEEPQALSYEYQARCPNDQNLIAVIGRDPESGACLRCNIQIEGTGRKPGHVVIDAGFKGPRYKDVGIRADRADGFHIRNLHVMRAGEHGLYIAETDGYSIFKVVASDNRNYGFLTFVSDHGLHDRCEAFGNSNAGVYPGAAPESKPRLNQRLTRCNSHHNVLGYSGTMGNNVLVEGNRFHHNTVGISTDSFLAAGHPGYPQDSAVFRDNLIYSNNLNPYVEGSYLIPSFPFPVGTGILITGGNDNRITGNAIYDNWRRGAMLVSVPGFASDPPQPQLAPTSYNNVYEGNLMGRDPKGTPMPNGVDFWWDEAGTGNCWQNNGPVTSDPPQLDACPGRSVAAPALGNPDKQRVLASCALWPDPVLSSQCDWTSSPPPPGGRAAGRRMVSLCPPLGPLACERQRPSRGLRVNARQSCAEWNVAGRPSRRAVINGLRSALAADAQFEGIPIVPEADALGHMERVCRQPLAHGFELFEVFTAHATFYAAAAG